MELDKACVEPGLPLGNKPKFKKLGLNHTENLGLRQDHVDV